MKARFLVVAIVLGLVSVPVSADSVNPGRVETYKMRISWGSGPLDGTQSFGMLTIDTRVPTEPGTNGTLTPENSGGFGEGGFVSFFIEVAGVTFTLSDAPIPEARTRLDGNGRRHLDIFGIGAPPLAYSGNVSDAFLDIEDEVSFFSASFPELSTGIDSYQIVPEPATLTLLGIGLIAGGLFRKRFK